MHVLQGAAQRCHIVFTECLRQSSEFPEYVIQRSASDVLCEDVEIALVFLALVIPADEPTI